MLTTQFFAMKIQRYMSEHGISSATLAEVAAKAFRNGALNPDAWRRTPLTAEELLASKMVNHPLTQFMFCSPGEDAAALVLARGARLRGSSRPPVLLRSVALRTRSFGSFEVFSPSIAIEPAPRLRPWPPRPRSKRPASARPTWTSPRSRTPNPGPRSCIWPRRACASTASRKRAPGVSACAVLSR